MTAPIDPRAPPDGVILVGSSTTAGLHEALAPYGLLAFDSPHTLGAVPSGFHRLPAADLRNIFGVRCVEAQANCLYFGRKPWWKLMGRRPVAYHAVRPHIAFEGGGLEPVWQDASGRPVMGWIERGSRRWLLVGLDVVEELVRHRQGDPERVHTATHKAAFGFEFERPLFLYDQQLLPDHRGLPWADRLGFLIVESWSRITGIPIAAPLPRSARGAIALTGDDDQAYLETYADQMKTIGDFPITYFLHPLTRHTPETLRALPNSVEIGVHPDALDDPSSYPTRCSEHTQLARRTAVARVRIVRNHGFLSDGYQGHLPAWEASGLELDVNLPGLDGTALNGSFLPGRARRSDASWSSHYTLLTAFGDGMRFILELTDAQAALRIRSLARQIEGDRPGVICLNFHPQNIDSTRAMHREVLSIAGRHGWIALGLETYLDWLQALEGVRLREREGRLQVGGGVPPRDLVLRIPTESGFRDEPAARWAGCELTAIRPASP